DLEWPAHEAPHSEHRGVTSDWREQAKPFGSPRRHAADRAHRAHATDCAERADCPVGPGPTAVDGPARLRLRPAVAIGALGAVGPARAPSGAPRAHSRLADRRAPR